MIITKKSFKIQIWIVKLGRTEIGSAYLIHIRFSLKTMQIPLIFHLCIIVTGSLMTWQVHTDQNRTLYMYSIYQGLHTNDIKG